MNRPVLVAVSVAVSASVGFIFGALFEAYNSKKLIAQTITQRDETQKLLGWYEQAFVRTLVLKDLANVKTPDDVEMMKREYRRNGAADVELFRKQAENMKKSGAKHAAIVELEAGISKMEQEYELRAP